jgi:DNA-binding MarR family transcriptional regulator
MRNNNRYHAGMNDPLLVLPGYVLARAAAASLARLNAALGRIGCRHSDVSLLLMIEANPGITASDAGRALDIARANMVPLITRLEKQALVYRTAIDGRSHGLFLAEFGKEKLIAAKSIIADHEMAMVGAVPDAVRAHMLPILMAVWRASSVDAPLPAEPLPA